MLVLGALSSRHQQPLASGRTPIQELLAMEADAAARGDLSTWLLAVGNAAPAETLAIARRYLGHADPAVRGASCVALRRVTDAAVVPLLVDLGLADAVATVRREALLVLGRRSEPAARAAIERIAQADPDEELRHKANELLRAGA
jgi:HEAT repeat protein